VISQIILNYPINPKVRPLETSRAGLKLAAQFEAGAARYRKQLKGFERLGAFLRSISSEGSEASPTPYWGNAWIPPLDAASICGLLLERRPTRFVEVGSGMSTKFARAAITHFGLKTKIISIDPQPRAEINALCDEIIRTPCEDVSSDFFESLSADDILFVDNSHRSFQNSDVTVFFTEILPNLPPGLIYGIHDIFLPYDYPEIFLSHYLNEQYLLAAYLFGGGGGDEILLPCAWISFDPGTAASVARLASEFGLASGVMTGGCFWARRGTG
jgi:hypothetical protein